MLSIQSRNKSASPKQTDETHNSNVTILNEIREKYKGTYTIPLKYLKISSEEMTIRPICQNHATELFKTFKTDYENGHRIVFPNAVGMVTATEHVELIQSGNFVNVEIIDGNHTLLVMKELSQLFPEEECFKERKVDLYCGLQENEAFTLALIRNEEASNSLKTSNFDKVLIMRKELKRRFNGHFSIQFLDHVYSVFNVVCPNDPKEEMRRKKQLQHLVRISTMEDECWTVCENIIKERPNISIMAFRYIGNLSKKQGLEILRKVQRKEIKLSEIKRGARNYSPEDGELVFQRLKKKKTNKRRVEDLDVSDSYDASETSFEEGANRNKRHHYLEASDESDINDSTSSEIPEPANEVHVRTVEMQLHETRMELRTMQSADETKQKELDEARRELICQKVAFKELQETNECILKENDGLQLELTHTKSELQLLQQKLTDIGRERDSLKSEIQKIKKQTQLPFSTGQPDTDKTSEKVQILPPSSAGRHDADNNLKKDVVGIVEYNSGKVYAGLLRNSNKEFVFCCAPLGTIKRNIFVKSEKDKSYIINASDKQSIDVDYLIYKVEAVVKKNRINPHILLNYENCVTQYITKKQA